MNKNIKGLDKIKKDLIDGLSLIEVDRVFKSLFKAKYEYAFHTNEPKKANECEDLMCKLTHVFNEEQYRYIASDLPYYLTEAYSEIIELAKQLKLYKIYINLIPRLEMSISYIDHYNELKNNRSDTSMLASNLGLFEYYFKEMLENKQKMEELKIILDSKSIDRYIMYLKLHEKLKHEKNYKKLVNVGIKEIKKYNEN